MGLYLCIFDGDGELDGIQVGSYADFNFFRNSVVRVAEGGVAGSRCPTLNSHHDSDGEWSPSECSMLIKEIELINDAFEGPPAIDFNSKWQTDVARNSGIVPKNLAECFFDVDGEPLLDRLKALAERGKRLGLPILFQ
ncbi:Imm70 family immunity protein [Dyella humicola]|uniref:Imm70 family immunity protein n=1 Tax=Dyella humicola TaxID=2992126 RepID=UPI00224EF634|nr:Imm70 family immunity protein [Dyella humicola]